MGTGDRRLSSMDPTSCVVLVGADSARQRLRHLGDMHLISLKSLRDVC